MRMIRSKFGNGKYPATAGEMYEKLGVRPGALPVDGMPEQVIDGVRVYVRPLPPNPTARRNFDGLRVMAICDDCNRHVAAGRLAQHACVRKAVVK